ncbi:hypothetical protein K438DRAFT_1774578 [Mycena galopus ATCC 62051]|nr:hypothetical protein K438DRAFT_1774578 [Mycena galopus ATCC 62051]
MACFNRSDWVSHGKTWKEVPKPVRQLCRNEFKIPESLASKILPDSSLSIHAFLDFTLPRPSSAGLQAPTSSAYFSKYSAETMDSSMLLRLHHLDLPPVKVINQLVHDKQQAWLDGFRSVKYAHLSGEGTTHFPLWVISFWNKAIKIRTDVRLPWIRARDWVNKQIESKSNPELRECAAEVSKLLGDLPWKGLKGGLSDTSPIHTLW